MEVHVPLAALEQHLRVPATGWDDEEVASRALLGEAVTSRSPPAKFCKIAIMSEDDRDALLSALACRWQGGDVSAFGELYRMTSEAVTGYLRRWVPSQEADDLVQEAYLRLIDARRTYRPGMPFRPWLFAIVRHTALDARRARRRRSLHEGASDRAPEPSATGAAEEHLDGKRLGELLGDLPETERDVVWLARVEGMTCVEIAKVVGASPGAVKVRLHRATARLRGLFARKIAGAGGTP